MLYVQFKLNECRERRVLKIPNKKLQYNETTVTILIFIRVWNYGHTTDILSKSKSLDTYMYMLSLHAQTVAGFC